MQNEFTSLLLPPLASRLRHHLPQLLSMPPVLAHTVYQVVEFDQQLRSRGYRPRVWPTVRREGDELELEDEDDEWEGLSETILGRQQWFERWLEGERECAFSLFSPLCQQPSTDGRVLAVFDQRYFDAIGASDAWHILSEDDYDAGENGSETRPTKSALRVKELAEQLAGAYSPLVVRSLRRMGS